MGSASQERAVAGSHVPANAGADALPAELAPRRLWRRLVQALALLGALALVALLAPRPG